MASAPGQPASSPPSWWQRTCRWLWPVLRWFWVSVVFVLIMAVLPSLLLLTPGTTPPYIAWFWFNWALPHLPVAIMVLLGLVGLTILSWVGSREGTIISSFSPDQQSRVDALKVLRKAYTDELAASLQGMARITLRLHERFDLTHPGRLATWQPGQPEQALPAGTTIVNAYDQAGSGLLILGEPGTGKSTLLYDLAQALLSRAEQNEHHRLPIILNLSSWATKQLPLEEWLVEELQLRYFIPSQLSQRWVQQAKLLLLLDGLDEVAGSARDACVEAINTYHSVRLVPLVVCSRQGEYEALAKQLTLQSAVVAQPLTTEEVKAYLKDAGRSLAAVRKVVDTNIVLRDLLTTPLMLSAVALTYRDTAVKDLPQLGTPEQQQQQVFEHYVERALERQTTRGYFTPQQTRQWLTWLAQRMQQFSLTEFYLERLQPTWLSQSRSHQRYPNYVVGLVFGLIGLFSLGFIGGPLFTRLYFQMSRVQPPLALLLIFRALLGLVSGLVGGSLLALLNGFLYNLDLVTQPKKWQWKHIGLRIIKGVLNGLLIGLLIGLPYGLLLGLTLSNKNISMITWIIVMGVIFSLSGGLIFGLTEGLLGIRVAEIRPAEVFSWSWKGMGWNLVKFLFLGILASLLIGLLVVLVIEIAEWIDSETITHMLSVLPQELLRGLLLARSLMPFLALLGGLIGGLTGGLSGNMLKESELVKPNLGMQRSAQRALIVGLSVGLAGCLVGGFLSWLGPAQRGLQWDVILLYALVIGLFIGLVGGLREGGIACIQHLVLRLLLRREGVMPWHYERFLDEAARHILLHKVGGGYKFIHRSFQDYVASLDSSSPTK